MYALELIFAARAYISHVSTMDLPRRESCPVSEKAAVNGHLAGLNLFVRLLDQFHVGCSFLWY